MIVEGDGLMLNAEEFCVWVRLKVNFYQGCLEKRVEMLTFTRSCPRNYSLLLYNGRLIVFKCSADDIRNSMWIMRRILIN